MTVDLDQLRTDYAGILRAVDPLLPEPDRLLADADGELLTARVGESTAAGVTRISRPDPDSLYATWGALDGHGLRVQLTGPDQLTALDALLDKWEEHLAAVARPGDKDCAATVILPSRLTAPARALTWHGLGAVMTVAARTTTEHAVGPPADGLVVRPLRRADLDPAIPLYQQVVDFDARFGCVTDRPSTPARLRDVLDEAIGRNATCAWVAERDGALVGLCTFDLPEHAGWVAPMTSRQPATYLGCLVVDAGVRGSGVGSVLVAEAHQAAAAAGSAVTLLHHSVPNPLSMPFWYRHGYRPLWTMWQRRPAIR